MNLTKYLSTLVLITLFTLLSACTRTLTVESGQGSKEITVDRDQVLSESLEVESTTPGASYEATRSCTKMGTCCKCGFTIHMEHECSCGIWRNCPGTQKVTLQPVTKLFRRHYRVKLNNTAQELHSPLYQETYTQTLASGSCN